MSDNRPPSPQEERKTPMPDDNASDDTRTAAEEELGLQRPAKDEPMNMDSKKDLKQADQFLVVLEGREHLSPHSWGVKYRIFLMLFTGALLLNATFSSAAPSGLIPQIIEHFGVSEEVGILLISIFVAGYCLGPLLWGPLSERYGRRNIFLITFIPYVGFQVGCALSKNIGSLIVFHFLGGAFASSPMTNSALMPFAGPSLAPLVAGFMSVSGVDWRWIFWLLSIFSGVCLLLIPIVLPETYAPYILYQEAKRLRKETGDNRWHAALEEGNESIRTILDRTIFKPFIMLFQEPMLAVITIYMSFIYGVIYLLFEALPIIFGEQHGLNAGLAGLPFLSLITGAGLGVIFYVLYFNKQYAVLHRQMAPRPVPPEVRLHPILIAAPGLAVAFFWVAWTSYPSISIASPIIALALLGSSALAINTVVRSTFGAGFPLFAGQMYRKLGTPGATSLLGGLAILFIPAPFFLIKYGKKIRAWSKNAVVREDE